MENEKGKLQLSDSDTKIAEFVITEEDNHVKIRATSGVWSIRYNNSSFFAQFVLMNLKDEKMHDALHSIIAVMYAATTIVPDVIFLQEVQQSYLDCTQRLKKLMATENLSVNQHDEILAEEKADYLAKEELKQQEDLLSLQYKGFVGSIEFSSEDACYYGKANIEGDTISYEGHTFQDLERDFKSGVDSYLEGKQRL